MMNKGALFMGLLFTATACSAEWKLPPEYVLECEGDSDCPGTQTCNLDSNSCVDPNQPICGNGVTELGEQCDSGQYNTNSYTVPPEGIEVCLADCSGPASYCGDGIKQDENEFCDDGPLNSDDYSAAAHCNATCSGQAGYCGDNTVDTGEACDDGNVANGDYCSSDCSLVTAICGDGLIQGDEVCDDGPENSNAWAKNEHCNATCTGLAGYCGDGTTQPEEACDSGDNNHDGYSLTAQCNNNCDGYGPHCGDGIEQDNEICDDGDNNTNLYAAGEVCNQACVGHAPYCGDNTTQDNEACDDGNTSDGDYCSANCQTVTAVCGDGVVAGNEVCDDGNANSNGWAAEEHCNASCTALAGHCGDNIVQTEEACDSGDNNNDVYGIGETCNTSCTAFSPYCGDGAINGAEACDDGQLNSNDYASTAHCNANCSGQAGYCGDNIQQDGESCDDGNTANGDYCSANCQEVTTICGDGLTQGTESCDDGSNNSNDWSLAGHCNATCTGAAGYCGDSTTQQEEACDAGDARTNQYSSSQICNLTCDGYAPYCGDGNTTDGEACDSAALNLDGYNNDGDEKCNATCTALRPYCGDAETTDTEACDTGILNTNDYGAIDRCNTICSAMAPICGDGNITAAGDETCDDADANTDSYGTAGRCNSTCNGDAPYCGDNALNGGETCDAGAANTDAYGAANSCNLTCSGLAPHCGDSTVNGGEACDLGDVNSDAYGTQSGCLVNCSGPPAYCGDELTNGAETCDDGNTDNGDYCSSSCLEVTTICGDGQIQGDEVCDDGAANTSSSYALNQTCNDSCSGYALYCGDGLKNGSEACDDGTQQNEGNGCSATCAKCTSETECPQSGAVSCGDGVVHYIFEGCDAGEENADFCFYGETSCVKCVPPGYEDLSSGANSVPDGCQYREIVGTYCGDGILNQEGIRGGISTEAGGVDTGQWEGCETGPWLRVDLSISTPHPYQANSSYEYTINAPAGATGIRVHFSRYEITPGYTTVFVGAHEYGGGNRPAFLSGSVPGQSMTIRLESLTGVSPSFNHGFDIDYYEYSESYAPSCSSLGASLGSGTAYCRTDCIAYDTSSCSIQEMVFVPAGPFRMGCNAAVDYECYDNESPYHEVYLDSFLIDKTEVTAGDYKACVLAGDCTYGGSTTDSYRTYNNGRDDHPINYVNYEDAKTYCEAQGKRLPTEAEWEKAARGTDGRKDPWGNSPAVSCIYVVMDEGGYGCGTGQTMEVGSKPLGVSPYGAHDMIGNVWEWTADWYDAGYYGETLTGGWVNPEGPSSGSYRVLRGGSYDDVKTNALRASVRNDYDPTARDVNSGFRCAQ